MPISLPTMMIRAAQNPENVDRLNLVTQSFSLYFIPATIIFLGQNHPVVGQNRRCQGRLAHAWAILIKWTIRATKCWIWKPEKNTLIVYSTTVLTMVLFLWLIVASSWKSTIVNDRTTWRFFWLEEKKFRQYIVAVVNCKRSILVFTQNHFDK